MNRIDWIVLRRISARVGLTLAVIYSLFALASSLDAKTMRDLISHGGVPLAVVAIGATTARAMVSMLPIIILLGTILGVLDLQARREMTVIQSTGASVWRLMRAPMLAMFVLGIFAVAVVDNLSLQVQRAMPVNVGVTRATSLWLEQSGADGDYVLFSARPSPSVTRLDEVTLYFTGKDRDRVEAASAQLGGGIWTLTDVTRYRVAGAPEAFDTLKVATTTSAGDLRVRVMSARDLTIPELFAAIRQRISDAQLRAGAMTSLFRLFALPFVAVGVTVIGFAFASGYRRTNKYGGMVLYGVVLGFVVYVVNELAIRSGFAGVVDPAFAAGGPAFVAMVIGLTVLLFREDGRA